MFPQNIIVTGMFLAVPNVIACNTSEPFPADTDLVNTKNAYVRHPLSSGRQVNG